MAQNKNRWGVLLFAAAVALLGLTAYLHFSAPFRTNPVYLRKVIPSLGLLLSVASFFVGHFSYPRVHNMKVYLIGYLSGLAGVAYFGLYRAPWPYQLPRISAAQFPPALLLLVFVNILVVLSVPSFVKYRLARSITLAAVAVEAVLIAVGRFAPGALAWITPVVFERFPDPLFLVGPVCLVAAVTLSVWRVRTEFFLGGVLSGYALLYAAAWLCGTRQVAAQQLLFAAAPLYLISGTMVHWLARMEHRIAYDPLLHIYNREYCGKIVAEQSSLNVSPPFGIAMVDIDHFKKVNDTHGHQAGDAVLYTVAQTVGKGIMPQGIVCRYGGEELAVFFPQKTAKEVGSIMERVRIEVGKTRTRAGRKQIGVTISCGVSHRESPSQSIPEVIQAADKALYRAKKGGRNQVRLGKTGSKS